MRTQWDVSAAARWEKWRRGGKLRFILRGALGFACALLAAFIPAIAIAWAGSFRTILEEIASGVGLFAILGAIVDLVTWSRMEAEYKGYLKRSV